MSHFIDVCEKHGTVLGQCKCISSDKKMIDNPCPGPPVCPVDLSQTDKPNRRIVVIDTERSGQPRPYADHERVYLVTIRYYDWQGNLVEDSRYGSMMLQNALSAVGGDKYVQVGERKSHSLDDYARTYVESVEIAGPHQVRVVIKEPYID